MVAEELTKLLRQLSICVAEIEAQNDASVDVELLSSILASAGELVGIAGYWAAQQDGVGAVTELMLISGRLDAISQDLSELD